MKFPVVIAALLISTPLLAAEREPLLAFQRLEARAEQAQKIETKEDADRILDEAARKQGFKDHKDFIANLPAEKIGCVFTEPFFSIKWDAATKVSRVMWADKVEWDNDGNVINDHVEITADVKKLTTGSLAYEIRKPTGELILKLKLDYQGSDGMSDTTYPYSAEAFGFQGACSTNLLPNKTLE